MGTLIEQTLQFYSCNPAEELFNAFVRYYPTVIPNAASYLIRSITKVNGIDGPGRIDQINFAPGYKYTFVRTQVKLIGELSDPFKFDIIEGDALGKIFTKIEVVITISADSPNKVSSLQAYVKFYAFENNEATQNAVKEALVNAEALFKAVDAHLLRGPSFVFVPLPLPV